MQNLKYKKLDHRPPNRQLLVWHRMPSCCSPACCHHAHKWLHLLLVLYQVPYFLWLPKNCCLAGTWKRQSRMTKGQKYTARIPPEPGATH